MEEKRPKISGDIVPILNLRFVGFCGVDETFSLEDDQDGKHDWPKFIEWGVLFRPEKEGAPRFPRREWVEQFVQSRKALNLAGHLCSSRCEQVLNEGDFTFVKDLHENLGFNRFQLNATKANGVQSELLGEKQVQNLIKIANEIPTAEFIIQRNEETRPLWMGMEKLEGNPPENISYLFDASVGRGVVVDKFERPKLESAKYGYAGGIKPENVETVVRNIAPNVPASTRVWIDMESGLRIPSNDYFSADRAWKVCEIIEDLKSKCVIAFEG
jgi:phosphoribosylanthranilate isomerase